jgi:hypothetical protein
MLVFLVMAHLFPIRIGMLRLAMVAAAALVWFSIPFLFSRSRVVTTTWIVCTVFFGWMLLGPGHADDSQVLRRTYIAALQKYLGVRYIWGGENSRGVDCSGLVRIGLIDADVNLGITSLNPALIREACALWWFDSSADALQHAYRHNTSVVLETSGLNQLKYSHILPGDLAVTQSGQHVLAYIGYSTWIAADPGPMRVVTVAAPSKSVWFDQPMRIVRWRQFQ